jgi:ankyrin repeat protein
LLWFDLAAGPLWAQDIPGINDRALLQAAALGDEALARFALERGADLEARGPRGDTPLLVAARRGHRSVAVILLDAGADIEAQGGRDGNTPLIAAGTGRKG